MIGRLTGPIQPYAWGSTTALPEFLGVEPTGKPQAELWLGAHPSAPASVDGEHLDRAVADEPGLYLGAASQERFGPQLPYLTKVLTAAQPLSLQAHPSRAQAEAGFAAENEAGVAMDAPERLYRDSWPKPEMICPLGEFEALCGFRDAQTSYALFSRLSLDRLTTSVQPLRSGDADGVREVFARLLQGPDPGLVGQVVERCRDLVDRSDELGLFARTAVETGTHFPADPGVLAALMMNRLALSRFDGLFLPAGNLHAYLHGTGVEVMANSDNVLRGGLTPKHVDVDTLLEILDFTPGIPALVEIEEEEAGVYGYLTPAPEFAVWRLEPAGREVVVPAAGTGRILLVVDGEVTVTGRDDATTSLRQGESAFLTADESAVRLTGEGTAFLSAPGV